MNQHQNIFAETLENHIILRHVPQKKISVNVEKRLKYRDDIMQIFS